MRAASKPHSKMAGGQPQWISGEDVSRPRPRKTRPHYRLDPSTPGHRRLRPDKRGIRGGTRRIVAAGHVDVDVPKTALSQMGFERRKRLGSGHIRHQSQIELCHRLVWKNGLAARPRITAD